MSPEQARGEGHRVDGRCDIYSLGAMFYELLAGRRTFSGATKREILEQIATQEPKPPRQIDDLIPKELERICLKALTKRASDRYTTALDMAEDLRNYLADRRPTEDSTATSVADTQLGFDSTQLPSDATGIADSDSQPIRIVPKGLRSFDEHDADFFLELLPGPRDRQGLPDSLRFWKTRIDESDPDNTFSVGLIYGPSGCGKSSLVKAGLLPRLSDNVIPNYLEATSDETEIRLLHGLRKRCPGLPGNLSLKETVAALRRGHGVPFGKKVLIVLDQFEQWLQAHRDEPNAELVQALRQCNGGNVQCIVMVRDDFWMAATRFMRELEVRLLEAHNSAAVDLFPIRHAEKVLAAFGRAFGALPECSRDVGNDHKEFLTQAINGLSEDGKVICVRLALFADMMKGKPWSPTSLKEVGGAAGIGLTFLEETFSTSTAPPEHRYHQKAARAVLKALLPVSGTDIKGHMKSYDELLEASGYAERPKDFDELVTILNSEIRLITPTDPEGAAMDDESAAGLDTSQCFYQLTHDYLVPPLRDWLTRKQRETLRGRTELRLAERAALWNARPENRHLPSWWENLKIRLFTDKKKWTSSQRKMMGKARQVHGLRSGLVTLVLVALVISGASIRNAVLEHQAQTQARIQERENATRAEGFVQSLLSAETTQVPAVVSELTEVRRWADPLLRSRISTAADGSAAKLHLTLALLPVDHDQIHYLAEQLPSCTLEQFPVVRDTLLPHYEKIIDTLWQLAEDEQRDADQRFQTAAALAAYAPGDERWDQMAPFVAEHLTNALSSVYFGQRLEHFEPAHQPLAEPLAGILADRSRSEKQRGLAALALADYLKDQPDKLADVILVADEFDEFSPLMDSLRPQGATVKQQLLREMHAPMPDDPSVAQRDAHWKRQSMAAATLVHLGYGAEVWPLLEFTPDPSLRSFIIYQLGKLQADHNTLAARLETEDEVSIRRALIQSLGGLDVARIPPADRSRIAEQLQALYVHDADPGVHGSTSWTLRKWGVTLPELPRGVPELTAAHRRWYVNAQGQTMVVIRNPSQYGNSQIDHSFAISSHEVTVAEYRRFQQQHGFNETVAPTEDCPVHGIVWYMAAEYCNWLSQQEGIPADQWVYEPNEDGQYAEGMRIKENFLELRGYRLPAEAEWEYACRAGTSATYGFGEPVPLLMRYSQYVLHSSGRSRSVESLLPNEAGLFDMHGNLWEWTQNPVSGPQSPVRNDVARVLRGGAFDNHPLRVRSVTRYSSQRPDNRDGLLGFRPARTYDLIP